MGPCVYCLRNGQLRREQILVPGRDLFVCAPRGQLVEGFLVVAPYECTGCLAGLPAQVIAELLWMKTMIEDFYLAAYGVRSATIYEQGRAGGGAAADEFPLHAHLSCLPLAIDIHPVLAARYLARQVSGLADLAAATRGKAYVYLDSRHEQRVYLPRSPQDRAELERLRLKPRLAELAGVPERGYWRDYPGDAELDRLIGRFATHQQRRVG
jgi:diadenosine tetraphosphate (Ap4A) HIT family hydrolase